MKEIIIGLITLIRIELLNFDIDLQIMRSNRFHKMVRSGKIELGDKNFNKYKNSINKMCYDHNKIRILQERWNELIEGV